MSASNFLPKKKPFAVQNDSIIEKYSSKQREIVHGCSLAGAFNVVSNIQDVIVLMHAPKGCSYISFCSHLSKDFLSASEKLCLPNLLCTNLQETDVIFGGENKLKDTLIQINKKFPSFPILIITSCSAGIIGENINSIINKLKSLNIVAFHI
ncbi:MAG: hypothetical protein GX638_13355, partial [Crenarchaeota archaeon]|nr:hypothetical protein [Thermoproteota archaeon]